LGLIEALRSSLRLLPKRDQRLLFTVSVAQMLSGLLDLAGVMLLGIFAGVMASSLQDAQLPEFAQSMVDFLGWQDWPTSRVIAAIGIAAAFSLLAKSVVSAILNRRILRFLASRQAIVSARLAAELLARPLTDVQKFSSQDIGYALTFGTTAATLQLLGQLVIALSEIALLVMLGVTLLIVQPLVTIVAIVYFGLLLLVLQKALGSWSSELGEIRSSSLVASMNAIQEALATYREITVLDRRGLYASKIRQLRWESSKADADSQFLALVPKLVFESALVLGTVLLAISLFATSDVQSAMTTMVLFLAAGSRVMPSLLRLQGATLGVRNAAGAAKPTFVLADALEHEPSRPLPESSLERIRESLRTDHSDFSSETILSNVCFTYPNAAFPAVTQLSLEIPSGSSVGIVGPSGAGKSTLADLILGIIRPELGSVVIGGQQASDAIRAWPGAITYVPQRIALINGTVRENIALGLPRELVEDDLVWKAIQQAELHEWAAAQEEGLNTIVGEGGYKMSGGQQQRLGIARALYTQPRLVVLDEATSALDADTEHAVSETIRNLGSQVTTVVIAHRLSTVKSLDKIVYMEGGRIHAEGTFAEVQSKVPNFARQAALHGL